MTRQSLAALRRTVTIDWPAANAEDARKFLVATARRDNDALIGRFGGIGGGSAPAVTAYANSPGNANLDSVTLPGPIVHLYDYRGRIVREALAALHRASPVVEGKYQASFVVLVDGVAFDMDRAGVRLARLDAAAEIAIVNTVPYARRLEIGKTKSGRSFVLQVPDRIMETVAKRVLMPRFGNLVTIEFVYLTLPAAYVTKGRLASHYATGRAPGARGGGVRRKRQQKPGTPVRSPAIVITQL